MVFTISISVLILLFLYPLTIYPIILTVLDKLFGKDYLIKPDFYPAITILIAAYNEESMIGDCIKSVLDSDYPTENIHILVGSDGSNDNTYNIVKSIANVHPNIKIFQFNRLGKNRVLNELYQHINTEFVMFLDADHRLRRNTLVNTLRLFANESIACVMNEKHIICSSTSNSGVQGEGFYHKFEKFYKIKESRIRTTVNVLGSYCIRTNTLKPLPNEAVCDDMYNILQVSLQKKRAICSTDALIEEVRDKETSEEMRRRIRMAAGQLSTVKSLINIINPFAGLQSFFFISHKFIRYMYCLIMLLVAGLTYPLLNENIIFFQIILFGQILFYLLALVGYILEQFKIILKPFSIPLFFVIINLGFLLGIIKFIFGKSGSTWERIDTRNNQTNVK